MRLEINCLPNRGIPVVESEIGPASFLPGVPHKTHWDVFLPYANDIEHPVWREMQQ